MRCWQGWLSKSMSPLIVVFLTNIGIGTFNVVKHNWPGVGINGVALLCTIGFVARIRHLDKPSDLPPSPGPLVITAMADVFPSIRYNLQVQHCPSGRECVWGEFGNYLAPGRSYGAPLATFLIHLNDRHFWSREQIADWLETLDLDISAVDLDNAGVRETM